MLSPEIALRSLTAVAQLFTANAGAVVPDRITAMEREFLAGMRVFQDNGNGVYDEGKGLDKPLANFSVRLLHDGQFFNQGVTDFNGRILFPLPWDGGVVDDDGYAFNLQQQGCQLVKEVDGVADLRDESGKIIGSELTVLVDCDSDIFPDPLVAITHNLFVCNDLGGDGNCDPGDPPRANEQVIVFSGAESLAAGLILLPTGGKLTPLDSGTTDDSGKVRLTTTTGDVFILTSGEPGEYCEVKERSVTRAPGLRDVSLAVSCS